ncbi:hypothetical protein [Elizabethkingia anophelis]|uniref:Uncharacterized protein n=1 Tax=Elizabethkingia anophelis TaxID=1117645 RepID=A0A7Z7PZ01_9FLAO|nr:hypothetical protein [Elizabethkingia anophelis]STD05132.1 Uncharacterised protein [Elizabethkingia anophelis]
MSIIWNNINDGFLPELEEPVLIAKEPTDDLITNCKLGMVLERSITAENGWFVGSHIIDFKSRGYWSYLLENTLVIPNTEDITILANLLQEYLVKLQLFDKKIQFVSACMIKSGNGLYALDYYILGILNRSSSLIYGFDTLIRSSNFISAVHLIRPHLDNYLRLLAAWLVENPHDFAKAVWGGAAVRSFKDKDGRKMTDVYLKEKATADFTWITDVYDETSAFIHFSNKHIINATTLSSEKENTLKTFIGKTDNEVSYHSKLEAVISMIEISNIILKRIYGWIVTKRIKG